MWEVHSVTNLSAARSFFTPCRFPDRWAAASRSFPSCR